MCKYLLRVFSAAAGRERTLRVHSLAIGLEKKSFFVYRLAIAVVRRANETEIKTISSPSEPSIEHKYYGFYGISRGAVRGTLLFSGYGYLAGSTVKCVFDLPALGRSAAVEPTA